MDNVFFTVMIDIPSEVEAEIRSQLEKNAEVDMEQHNEFVDTHAVKKMFDLKDDEIAGDYLNAVYTKLALKNI